MISMRILVTDTLEFFLQDDGTDNPDSEAMEGKRNAFATL